MADPQTKVQEDFPDLEVAESSPTPAPLKKVELDLDDAPFLQPEENDAGTEDIEKELPATTLDDEEKARRKKKLIMIIAAAAAGLIAVVCVAIWWFVFRTPPPPPPEAMKPEVIVVPSTPAETPPADIVLDFAPFVIPVKNGGATTGFLVCKFAAITQNESIRQEVGRQLPQLRDAIYFYLRGKDSAFLLDARNGEAIKKDLLSVFNDYLSQGKLEDIVFESYLNK